MKKKHAIAHWRISLNVSCPKCGHYFDLTDEADFWECSGVNHAGQEIEGYETECPECSHEFECEFVY